MSIFHYFCNKTLYMLHRVQKTCQERHFLPIFGQTKTYFSDPVRRFWKFFAVKLAFYHQSMFDFVIMCFIPMNHIKMFYAKIMKFTHFRAEI